MSTMDGIRIKSLCPMKEEDIAEDATVDMITLGNPKGSFSVKVELAMSVPHEPPLAIAPHILLSLYSDSTKRCRDSVISEMDSLRLSLEMLPQFDGDTRSRQVWSTEYTPLPLLSVSE